MRISYWSSDVCSADLARFDVSWDGLARFSPPCSTSIEQLVVQIHHEAVLPWNRIITVRIIDVHVEPLTNDIQRLVRSEERRVGKERVSPCRSRCSPYH